MIDGSASGHGSRESGDLTSDFLSFGEVRNGIKIVGDDGQRVARSDKEAVLPQDHVPITVSIKRHTQDVVALKDLKKYIQVIHPMFKIHHEPGKINDKVVTLKHQQETLP